MTPQTKRLVAILFAVVAFSLLLQTWDKPEKATTPARVSRPTTARRAGANKPREATDQVVVLRSAELAAAPPAGEEGRNPFRFYDPPPPPPPPPPRLSASDRAAMAAAAAAVSALPPPVPAPPPKPQPPVIRFKYLGSFGPDSGRIAVFQDGENTINARVGDVLLTKFRVAKIGYESADIEFVEFPDAPAQRLPVGR